MGLGRRHLSWAVKTEEGHPRGNRGAGGWKERQRTVREIQAVRGWVLLERKAECVQRDEELSGDQVRKDPGAVPSSQAREI